MKIDFKNVELETYDLMVLGRYLQNALNETKTVQFFIHVIHGVKNRNCRNSSTENEKIMMSPGMISSITRSV